MNSADSRTSAKRRFSSAASGAYCALTSISGIFSTTASKCTGAATHNQIGREDDNSCYHRVIGEAEVVMEAFPARADGPAHAREGEAPDRRAEQRQRDVAAERRPKDTRRNRDERAHNRCNASEQDRPVAEALEPALSAVEPLPV